MGQTARRENLITRSSLFYFAIKIPEKTDRYFATYELPQDTHTDSPTDNTAEDSMAFKSRSGGGPAPKDPEVLLRDLRKKTIEGILAHQADVIRCYMSHVDKADVALQLPTGSGKTLVGLLIAEWRRRKFKERVLYLCPTKQLVHQVAEQARKKYGIELHPFTGSKSQYEATACSDWQNADAVGVTTYSGIFNTRPFFSNPQSIILDDAHSAENYIASFWSVQIEKRTNESIFSTLQGVLLPLMSSSERLSLTDEREGEAAWVSKVPTPYLQPLLPEITAILDAHTEGNDLRYSWQTVRPILDACHVYISTHSILIRPLIPPSHLHHPFSGATQRVYMSATLGSGGDLERITGRGGIHRIPAPSGWDRQGIGRRFFIFPKRSLDDDQTREFCVNAAKSCGRSLYLVPDDGSIKKGKSIAEESDCTAFSASQIEESKEPFVQSTSAMAIVANRYDGIDLSGDECRLLLIDGLPKGSNLQERFFVSRIGAQLLLDDRILTRVVQGFGRCTRSANDYAAVVILGDSLNKYLMTRERRKYFHPEIQAEIDFGLEQSKLTNLTALSENLAHFMSQDDEWEDAEQQIVDLRSELEQAQLPATAQLSATVSDELSYQTSMCAGDYAAALESCRSILGKLTDSTLRGYRALWYYLAGSAAWLAHNHGQGVEIKVSREYYERAKSSNPSLRWLANLGNAMSTPGKAIPDEDSAYSLIERIESVLEELGTTHDRKYSAFEASILSDISQDDDGRRFERGREQLGRLLGYSVGHTDEDAGPDPWWIADASLCFSFEDHAEGKESTVFPANKARQAASHPEWIRAKVPETSECRFVPILVTPCRKATSGAMPHLASVQYWNLRDFREWAKKALQAMRQLRTIFPGEGNMEWRQTAAARLKEADIAPAELEALLSETAAEAMTEA